MAYAVRGKSSSVFGPSVYQGVSSRRSLALTFDDGPSERTPEILSLLNTYQIPSTFFQCGTNVRRLPEVARIVLASGHDIGNHTDTHPNLSFYSTYAITEQFRRAQHSFEDLLNYSPSLMRAPFGARWFGFREMQRQLNLLGVMWTVIGRDWKLPAPSIAKRLLQGARNGTIFCLHDGQELQRCSPTSATAEALRIAIPQLLERGYQFETVNRILCPKN